MEHEPSINIELVYITPDSQSVIRLEVEQGCTIEAAIVQSGLLVHYPEIDLTANKVGVFGKTRPLDDVLAAGDRIEIYRPLLVDPKEMRRRRAIDNSSY